MEVICYGIQMPEDSSEGYILSFGGLHLAEKPTTTWGHFPVGNGSLFAEWDTGDVYYFNEGTWTKWGA